MIFFYSFNWSVNAVHIPSHSFCPEVKQSMFPLGFVPFTISFTKFAATSPGFAFVASRAFAAFTDCLVTLYGEQSLI